MSEVGLSSPPIATLSPLTVPSSTTPTPEPLNPVPEPNFWVELRHTTAEERNYEDFHLNLGEIVAEHTEGSREFYYVLLGDNKHHKIKAKVVREEYPDLLKDFKRRANRGLIKKFNPHGASVHPLSRSRPKDLSESSSEDEYASESPEESDQLEESDSDSDGFVPAVRVRQLRSTTRLPFSPAKAPTKHRIHRRVQSSDSEDEIAPTRRSTRSKRNTISYRDDDEYEDEEGNGSDAIPSAPKKKKRARAKASRPAYGHFREVADLELDEQSDDETLPLRAHRDECEKCRHPPSHILLKKLDRRRKKKGSGDGDEEDEEDEEERDNLESLGGWVRCLKCPVVMHWKCLNMEQRSEIRRAALERDMEEFERKFPPNPDGTRPEGVRKPSRRAELDPYETTEFICIACMKGGSCIGCGEVALKPDPRLRSQDNKNADEDIAMEETEPGIPKELCFRCITCKRLSHYEHLPPPNRSDENDWDAVSLAKHYSTDWLCGDCASFTYRVEKIIAWRPSPERAPQPDEPNYRDPLPREYLIKWKDRSYKRVTWVPHMWILATHGPMLRHFTLGSGQKVTLMERPVVEEAQDPEPTVPVGDTRDSAPPVAFGDIIEDAPLPSTNEGPAEAMPDAHLRIPPAWKTVDRVLDILLWRPKKGGDDEAMKRQREIAFEFGEQPSDEYVSNLGSWEKATKSDLAEKDIHQVAYAFFKWNDLGYEDCSWDTPPRPGEFGYQSFKNAFKRFLDSRIVWIPRLGRQGAKDFDNRKKGSCPFVIEETPALGQSPDLKLMPFQVDGLRWLSQNWWDHQHCILADEMGLGKTIQIVTFIGLIIKKKKAAPCLVVVPNSTITSWVREFERWAPRLRVVPYYGEAKSREIVRRYELTHDRPETGYTNLKYHVLVTTYETITNSRDFGPVFKQAPRWEALVVDEGQRLKNDSSLIFKKLTELNSVHRIIMTGTPLNNNIRELFNLLNFLDPDQWGDLKALEKQYEELTEELVKTLHTRLRPYFLRRIKAEVLQLPPKNEVIVPVSMTPLQKEIYRSILSQNLEVLKFLSQPTVGTRSGKNITRTNLNNMLMQLRKCLQHPYTVNEGIEPKDLAPSDVHEKLISASAKLILLRMMLPKLKERGHRVLLFSQFKLVLDFVEDFLDGEGIKHLRLDGDTPSPLRQKGIDEFNKPGSDTFIYLLTTRAGGVGINLYTADTVIIFDPDFNPHQDLQAIARAHRYGQEKTCLVFKLMVKNSAEERIMQVGKKKLALDHVIVQKMDDELGEDVQSILTFGAQQLFQDEDTDRGITYSEADIQSLIERTEKEGDQLEQSGQNQPSAFSFAKVWAADKEALTEMDDVTSERTGEVGDSWAQVLAKLEAERGKVHAQEVTGRGARRKAAPSFLPERNLDVAIGSDGSSAENSPVKPRKNRKKLLDREDYSVSAYSSDGRSESGTDAGSVAPDEPFLNMVRKTKTRGLAQDLAKFDENYCGLCGTLHTDTCHMVQNADNLVEYRAMLMEVTNEEPIEMRREAVQVIDEKLLKMGKLDLIKGQPAYLADKSKKRKNPHEPDQGENVVGHPEKVKKPKKPRKPHVIPTQTNSPEPWKILNRQSFVNTLTPTLPASPTFPPAADSMRISGSSGLLSSFPANPLRPPKKAKKSTPSALVSTVDNVCPLCGGLRHKLDDCPAPKGGLEKVEELYRRLSTRPGGIDDFQTLSWLQKERSRLQALGEAARAGSSRLQPPTNMDST